LALFSCISAHRALAQDAASCAPTVGRLVSVQGNVDVQRAGTQDWVRIKRLDTSVCTGDRVRTAPLSRAALFVQPETLLRVDQNTTIALSQTTAEVVVEFFQDDVIQAARDAQSCGAGYFITRFPKKLRVTTPHMNAAVEGTEFEVDVRCASTELAVIEGAVRSQAVATNEEHVVNSGQMVIAGPSMPGTVTSLVKPADAVQWVLYYPPLSELKDEAELPTAAQCRSMTSPADRSCLTQRAEVLLGLGRTEDALRDIDEVLRRDATNGEASALRAVIQVAANDTPAALQSANAATASAPEGYRSWLALSYAQQSAFDLEPALASAQKAQVLEPRSSLINARVAELLLSLGRTREAEAAAQAVVNSNPDESRAHTTLGFVHLAQIDTKAARSDFEAAIAQNSFDALPRLGLGLVLIRGGELVAGREQLEIAVALDPTNSLLRSYVGKAYYEENTRERDQLAASQFGLAKQLDPNDPTPWFYDAILKDSQTRPAEALQDLDRSTELNDERAVYRSRQMLDQDLAARNVSQATVYNELGFAQRGLTEASESLAVDPANGSAHRFLADAYATLPRHDISRASELLQAQLRQPLGAQSLQAQLANDIAFRDVFFGPAAVGPNEFNPLFLRDGNGVQVFGLFGNNDTYGDQVIVDGLHGPVSFSLSQFKAHTDGYRPNNDDTQRQYDGFVQAQLGLNTSAQLELTHAERESGDLQSAFDPTFFIETLRSNEDTDTQRFGLRQSLGPSSDILVSVIRQDRENTIDIDDPFFPATLTSHQKSWKAEMQYLISRGALDVILGAGYFEGDSSETFDTPFFVDASDSSPDHLNAYGYFYFPTGIGLPQLQLGVSYDDLSSEVGDQQEVNPKLGLIWKLTDALTVRAAGFRVLKRRINSDQGLEQTQLAGINQFFDDANGTVSEGGGLAADFTFTPELLAGLQYTRRDLDVPFAVEGEVIVQSQREETASGYVYWLPARNLSVSLEPRYQDFDGGEGFDQMELTEIPLSVRYFLSAGLWMGVSVTSVDQSGEFDGPGGEAVAGSDDFVLLDAIIAYRLPRRLGTISLQGRNLLDEEFQFQEFALGVLPRYIPEAQYLLRLSISF
jgi:Tfp pilus assembly protein PilF